MKINCKVSTILFFLILCLNTWAQKTFNNEKDSLKRVLLTQAGKEKLTTYSKLIRFYFETNTNDKVMDTLLIYYDVYDKEARKQNFMPSQGYIRSSRLKALINRNKYDVIIARAYDDLEFLKENKLWEHYFESYNALVEAYTNKQQYGKALTEAKKAYKISKEIDDTDEDISSATYNIAYLSKMLNRYAEAEGYFKEFIESQSKKEETTTTLLYSYEDLGHVLIEQKKYDEALAMSKDWLKAVEKFRPGQPQPTALYMYYSFLAYLHTRMKQFDKVEYYCNLSEQQLNNERAMSNLIFYRALVLESKGKYEEAIEMCDKAHDYMIKVGNVPFATDISIAKAGMLDKVGRCSEIFPLYKSTEAIRDSLRVVTINAQLDELRTVYEIDKIEEEKETIREYMYLAISGVVFLVILLIIWIYYNRKITKKNTTLVNQIKILQTQQEKEEAEFLRIIPIDIENIIDNDLCPEKRKDQLCIAIHNALLKEKAYRDPTLTRDTLIERLGSNKELFTEAFQYCFGMSFPEYLNSLRLKDAITLLEKSDLTIEEISEKVGFGTVRTFQRQFQTKYNMSPKEYRKAAMK